MRLGHKTNQIHVVSLATHGEFHSSRQGFPPLLLVGLFGCFSSRIFNDLHGCFPVCSEGRRGSVSSAGTYGTVKGRISRVLGILWHFLEVVHLFIDREDSRTSGPLVTLRLGSVSRPLGHVVRLEQAVFCWCQETTVIAFCILGIVVAPDI